MERSQSYLCCIRFNAQAHMLHLYEAEKYRRMSIAPCAFEDSMVTKIGETAARLGPGADIVPEGLAGSN